MLNETKKIFTFFCLSLLKGIMSLYRHNNCISSISIRDKDVQDSMYFVAKEGVAASVCSMYD